MILELKDKLAQKFGDMAESLPIAEEEAVDIPAGANLKERELFEALEALGYQAREIKTIYPDLKPLLQTEDEQVILKKALQLLMRG